jgi:ribosomal protein S18 acetylase RimI-like enzyme
VHPDRQHRGIGTALVVDCLTWVQSRGATSLLVNTQEQNTTALGLYEHLGFQREVDGLAVLERDLDGPGTSPLP